MPILLVHGTADLQMPWEGGCVANLGGLCNRGRVISAEETRDRGLAANGLAGVTPTEPVIEIAAEWIRAENQSTPPWAEDCFREVEELGVERTLGKWRSSPAT
jgi:poly(3-hydroxybutyrate) depolymerase